MSQQLQPDLAQQAFNIYDSAGEEAMLSFLIVNEKPQPAHQKIQEREYNLTDGTAVRHLGDLLATYKRVDQNHGDTRTSRIPACRQPRPIDLSTPLLRYPTILEVIQGLLDQAESEARKEIGLIADDYFLNVYDALRTMPNLEEALRKAVELQGERAIPGARIDSYMDQVIEDCASDAYQHLPESQKKALMDLAIERLEKVGKTAEEI